MSLCSLSISIPHKDWQRRYVENISDFYILLRHYIGIVFILFFKRHNHSDFIALKIC